MSVRNEAQLWLKANKHVLSGPMYVSKFYEAHESWPKISVWWPQIPLKALEENTFINILCQKEFNSNSFYHLKVRTSFLLENKEKFHIMKGRIMTLYLYTDLQNQFKELRGRGGVDFRLFLVHY